jgi:3-deoxy-D-manno-octulosonate 8-phosphate phosphatase KdsC-like HAD superfamily phosphatase
MKIAGFSAAPADAHETVLATVNYICKRPGGRGAVREMLEFIQQ